jgi:hypothetical protein
MLIQEMMTKVVYNKRGNQVEMWKERASESSAQA